MILLDEKSYENILVYNILYKTLIGAKPLRIRCDKSNGFIKAYDTTRYLVLFGAKTYNRSRYLKSQKKVVLHMLFLIIMQESKIKTLGKALILHNAILLIKLVFKKNENHYYYKLWYKLYMLYSIMIEVTFLEVLMLRK